jgi:hypothetical protein
VKRQGLATLQENDARSFTASAEASASEPLKLRHGSLITQRLPIALMGEGHPLLRRP